MAELVDGVTKLDQIKFKSREEAQAESFRKMLLAMVRDLRVILVKLADRTHNMRTHRGHGAGAAPGDRARDARDLRADRRTPRALQHEARARGPGLQGAVPAALPACSSAPLKRARGNQKEFLNKIEQQLNAALMKSRHRGARGRRARSTCTASTSKMRRKRAPLVEIVDVYGLRIVVDIADTCYRALGVVHAVFKPMPGRFKDYIAIPRVNGYQSLHTTLFGPNGVPIEVQIRTEDMHRVAEAGIAAHWKYKERRRRRLSAAERAREWLVEPRSTCRKAAAPEEFLESVKVDLFPDKVYVFTPKGEILRLPSGATVVDFAYAVHTDVGNRCVAAKVDRRLTPLRTLLRNGQTVEIITAKGATPNPSWVNFVVTAKARSAIRHYLKSLRRSEAIELGAQAASTRRWGIQPVARRRQPIRRSAPLVELGMKDLDELYEKIGLGERLAPLVARRLLPERRAIRIGGAHSRRSRSPAPRVCWSAYARCCFPIPDDPDLRLPVGRPRRGRSTARTA